VAPPTSTAPRPSRLLISLVLLVVIMLLGILTGSVISPGAWHNKFKVGLGLDLTSGTTVTLKAQQPPSMSNSEFTSAMSTAVSIMNNRVNGAGFTGATVVPQGANLITVTVPNKQAQQVVSLVGTTAQLRFRQVLLTAPNLATSASPTPTPTPTPTPSSSPSAKASSSPTPSSGALGAAGSGSAGQGLSVSAARLGGAAPKPQASPSPTPSASPSPSPSPSAGGLATTSDPEAQGDASLLTATTKADFDRLNCSDKNWQSQIYGSNSSDWDNPKNQIVTCDAGEKYALAASTVTGDMLKNGGASSQLQSSGDFWVNLTFNAEGTKAFGQLSTTMYDKYYDATTQEPTSELDYFAIVLDGVPQSIAYMAAILNDGSATIRGSFTQSQASQLVNVLNYGALPLTFQQESVESITPSVGSSQLHAGLIAAAIGLFLVVCYSFLYYRGLGIVSVSSLAIAATLSYLSVVLLSKYEGFALDLAGIAGLVVAIGITADSFVVFFERLRDEVREGTAGSLRTAVERGWVRARRTILVSDTVTFIAAALLWKLAIGDVKNFGFTLGLTTLVDIIVVFLFTKPMVTILARTRFFGGGHRLSGLDPARLGARTPWRGSRRTVRRPAAGRAGGSTATSVSPARTDPKEA
jgi:preprotein translocase subunit SecD